MGLFDKKSPATETPTLTTPETVEKEAPPTDPGFKSGVYTLDPLLTAENIVRLLNEMVKLGKGTHGVDKIDEMASKDGKPQFKFSFKKFK